MRKHGKDQRKNEKTAKIDRNGDAELCGAEFGFGQSRGGYWMASDTDQHDSVF